MLKEHLRKFTLHEFYRDDIKIKFNERYKFLRIKLKYNYK